MFSLLKFTYKPGSTVNEHVFDCTLLEKWHRLMFSETKMPATWVGKFRRAGAYSNKLNGSRHAYPHHAFVVSTLPDFCRLVYHLASLINQNTRLDTDERVMYVFALAAFAQCHFVDLHPFCDGNGRMFGRSVSLPDLNVRGPCGIPSVA